MRLSPVFEDISAKQIMNRVKTPEMPFRWSINPYRGCTHGCSFCYARSTHTFMGLTPDDAFRHHIFVKIDAANVLEEQLARKLKKHGGNYGRMVEEVGLVNIGTATDPYQPIEARREETRKCLEVLRRYRIRTSIITRSPLILRDIGILQDMNIDSINISVNTLDKSIWRNLEPSTPAPIKRLETVRTLADAGLPVGILMAPVMPFLTDSTEHLTSVITRAVEHRTAFIIPSALRLNPDVKEWFMQTLDQHYPELSPRYQRLYRGAYPSSSYVQAMTNSVKQIMQKIGFSSQRGDYQKARSYTPGGREVPELAPTAAIPVQKTIQLSLPI